MEDLARTRVVTAQARLPASIALRPHEQAQGLQDRRPLRPREALLFPYASPRPVTFHMGRVAYPIDVVFIDGFGRVARVVESAEPGREAHWGSPSTRMVVETCGGAARRLGMVVGAQVAVGMPPALIESPPDFAATMLEGMARSQLAPHWQPDVPTRGRTESAVVDAATVASWVDELGLVPGGREDVLRAATSPEGWQLIADALVLSGLTDIAKLGPSAPGGLPDRLVLTRGRHSPLEAPPGR